MASKQIEDSLTHDLTKRGMVVSQHSSLVECLSAYYNQYRSHQALENQTPVEALQQKGSIQQCLVKIQPIPVVIS